MPEKGDGAWYIISVAAEKAEVHEQTLRHYERLGLISPARKGNSPHSPRLYSDRDIERVIQIRNLMQDVVRLNVPLTVDVKQGKTWEALG